MLRMMFMVIAMIFSSAAVAQSANQYSCTVIDMTTFGDDAEFVAKNLRKKFLISVGEDQIYLTQTAEDFTPYQTVYTIIRRNLTDVFAIDVSGSSLNTIAISEFFFRNTFSATLVLQAALTANVWKLDCQSQ